MRKPYAAGVKPVNRSQACLVLRRSRRLIQLNGNDLTLALQVHILCEQRRPVAPRDGRDQAVHHAPRRKPSGAKRSRSRRRSNSRWSLRAPASTSIITGSVTVAGRL